MGAAGRGDSFRRAGGDKLSPVLAGFRAEIEDPVGIFDDIQVVLNHEQRISLFDQAMKQGNQQADVLQMKPGGWFIQDEQRRTGGGLFLSAAPPGFLVWHRGLAQVRDELEPLGLAAGKLAEGLAAAEVAKAHLRQELQGGTDLLMALAGARSQILGGGKKGQGFGGGHLEELVDGFAEVLGGENVGLEASPFA